MTAFTPKGKKKVIKIAVIVLLAVCLALGCAVIMGDSRQLVLSSASCDEAGVYSTAAGDMREQVEFLGQFNITVEPKSRRKDSVVIPETFNNTYKQYNRLQQKAGLNLLPYKGKEASRITYKIKDSKNYVTLLIYKGYVIGGHVGSGIYGQGYKPLV